MDIVNMHDAKTHLSKLIERAMRGEEIIVAKGRQADGQDRAARWQRPLPPATGRVASLPFVAPFRFYRPVA